MLFNKDFAIKNPLLPLGFEPLTFELVGITILTAICSNPINQLAPIVSQSSRVPIRDHEDHICIHLQ